MFSYSAKRTSYGNLHPREWVKHFPSDTFTNNLIQAVKIHEGTADGAGEMVIQSDQQPQSVSVQQREVPPAIAVFTE
jgi:uncharacterized protein YheU (UPF0270 family)